jgi:hypothetical protein
MTKVFSTIGFNNAFKNNLKFSWNFDLSHIPENSQVITTAYLVFPTQQNKYYCDIFGSLDPTQKCMEMDLVEISGRNCVQSTYHASQTDTCNANNKACLATNYLTHPKYNVNDNYKKIKFEAQLNKDGTFNLSINGTAAQMPQIGPGTKNTIQNRSQGPAVLVFSIWQANAGWWPGKTINDHNGPCSNYNQVDNNKVDSTFLIVSDVTVSTTTTDGSIEPSKFPIIENSCSLSALNAPGCNWINKNSCKNITKGCCAQCQSQPNISGLSNSNIKYSFLK